MQKLGVAIASAFVAVNAAELSSNPWGQPASYGGYGHQNIHLQHAPIRHQQHAPLSYAPVKPLHAEIGNDGYKVRPRSDPHIAPREPIYAKCLLKDPEEESYNGGVINFVQQPGKKTELWGEIWGITPGLHGFHIHALGDLREGCASTAGHFNPTGTEHGAHDDHPHERHVGDLQQANANKHGVAYVEQHDMLIDLWGNHSIIGRSLVLHAGEDDLGRGGDAGSRANGNSGPRIACCTIGLAAGPKKQVSHGGYGGHGKW